MLNPVATTSLLVAAVRAEESRRADRLFDDPFAAALAGELGPRVLAEFRQRIGPGVPILEVRTRFFDEAMARAQAQGLRQVVILAAGMDARAFRLPWAAGTRLFELDQLSVLDYKARALEAAAARCERTCLGVDLAGDWSTPLVAAGFQPDTKTVWLVEGLSQYLPEAAVRALFAGIDALSCSGSRLLFDVVSQASLVAPTLVAVREYMSEIGAPWIFASDDPASLLGAAWSLEQSDPAALGNSWQRWPYPAQPGRSEGALLDAQKR